MNKNGLKCFSQLEQEPRNAVAQAQLEVIEQAKIDLMNGQQALTSGDYLTAVQDFSRVLEVCQVLFTFTHSVKLKCENKIK